MSPRIRRSTTLAVLLTLTFALAAPRASAQIVAGSNLSGGIGAELNVPFNPASANWILEDSLLFIPDAPPMTKFFETPRLPTGGPILLDSQQPFPFVISEFYNILGGLPGTPPGRAVSDWHELILTPGWEWVLPGDPNFPGLFPPGTSLITRNGAPWPSDLLPGAPNEVNVLFPPIGPGEILDIHKALLWVGTDTQRIWGDDPTETGIVVIEYPTPEPSSLVLGALALLGLVGWQVRKRRK